MPSTPRTWMILATCASCCPSPVFGNTGWKLRIGRHDIGDPAAPAGAAAHRRVRGLPLRLLVGMGIEIARQWNLAALILLLGSRPHQRSDVEDHRRFALIVELLQVHE